MLDRIVQETLNWSPAKEGFHSPALIGHLCGVLQHRVTPIEVDEALEWLTRRGRVERNGELYRLSEPDRSELELYDALEHPLQSSEFRIELGVRSNDFVFQNTTVGGANGAGPFTLPDFTLAAIQAWRFDPQRTLEVFSFEVKNRKGTSVSTVYQVVAHGRFVHYPYLVCPRSNLFPATAEALRQACSGEGVGLVLFDIDAEGDGTFSVGRLKVEVAAKRRSPDPHTLERHLLSRLHPENIDLLEGFVRGARA